ncbi:hypothetical protein A2U01_0038317, partial [Trifolium medium]|nr:hypothetical protein [Trifolium medium]
MAAATLKIPPSSYVHPQVHHLVVGPPPSGRSGLALPNPPLKKPAFFMLFPPRPKRGSTKKSKISFPRKTKFQSLSIIAAPAIKPVVRSGTGGGADLMLPRL